MTFPTKGGFLILLTPKQAATMIAMIDHVAQHDLFAWLGIEKETARTLHRALTAGVV